MKGNGFSPQPLKTCSSLNYSRQRMFNSLFGFKKENSCPNCGATIIWQKVKEEAEEEFCKVCGEEV